MLFPMTPSRFEKFVIEQAGVGLYNDAYNAIGLCGESGEVAEWVKKVKLRSKPSTLTEADLLDELGDVLHYLTRMAVGHDWSLEQVMARNAQKLQERYAATAKDLPCSPVGSAG